MFDFGECAEFSSVDLKLTALEDRRKIIALAPSL